MAVATYLLDLHAAAGPPEQETVDALSDEEALELARLRLLLTSDFVVVKLACEDRLVGTFVRDSALLDFKLVR